MVRSHLHQVLDALTVTTNLVFHFSHNRETCGNVNIRTVNQDGCYFDAYWFCVAGERGLHRVTAAVSFRAVRYHDTNDAVTTRGQVPDGSSAAGSDKYQVYNSNGRIQERVV